MQMVRIEVTHKANSRGDEFYVNKVLNAKKHSFDIGLLSLLMGIIFVFYVFNSFKKG